MPACRRNVTLTARRSALSNQGQNLERERGHKARKLRSEVAISAAGDGSAGRRAGCAAIWRSAGTSGGVSGGLAAVFAGTGGASVFHVDVFACRLDARAGKHVVPVYLRG